MLEDLLTEGRVDLLEGQEQAVEPGCVVKKSTASHNSILPSLLHQGVVKPGGMVGYHELSLKIIRLRKVQPTT